MLPIPRGILVGLGAMGAGTGMRVTAPSNLPIVWLNRSSESLNVFIVAVPLKIFVGLAMLAASVAYLGPVVAKIFASIFTFWEALFAHG